MTETEQPSSGERGICVLQNKTFDEIAIGDTASIERTLTSEDIQVLALLTGYACSEEPNSDAGATAHLQGMSCAPLLASLLSAMMASALAIASSRAVSSAASCETTSVCLRRFAAFFWARTARFFSRFASARLMLTTAISTVARALAASSCSPRLSRARACPCSRGRCDPH